MAVNDCAASARWRARPPGALGGELRGRTVALLGLTFKPNTDDMRDSPSIPLVTALQDLGAKVRAYDPVGMEQAKPLMSNVAFCDDAYACAEGASALVIVTEWEQFRALDFKRLKSIMVSPVLVGLAQHLPAPRKSPATASPMRASGGRAATARGPIRLPGRGQAGEVGSRSPHARG